jgi:RNA 2',3'-cyclic 3'-phosphodiesterase
MRLFIGLELDDEVRESAAAVAASLRQNLEMRVEARWIPANNFHLTLWFIGEVAEDRAEEILHALRVPLTDEQFDIHIRGAGAFPPSGAPRVFWLGVTSGAERLARLHREVARRLLSLGIEPERRPYSAHLTVARIKAIHGRDYRGIRAALRAVAGNAGTSRVRAVTVFRSRLSPKGATYDPLLRVPLQ